MRATKSSARTKNRLARTRRKPVSGIRSRQIFGEVALTRLQHDEPISASDPETGIQLHYRFCHLAGGRLSLSHGPLDDRVLTIGCGERDLNLVATILLDGIKARLG